MRVTFYGLAVIGTIASETVKAFDKVYDDGDYDSSLAQLDADEYGSVDKNVQDWMLAQTMSKASAEPENEVSAPSTIDTSSEVNNESDAFVTTESEAGSESEGSN